MNKKEGTRPLFAFMLDLEHKHTHSYIKQRIMKNIKFIPKTILGKCSVVFVIVMPIFFYIGVSFVNFYEPIPAGETILCDIVSRPGVALSMLAGFIFGITAFFTGIIGIIKKKDFSVLVFLSTILGFLVLCWCLIQILFS